MSVVDCIRGGGAFEKSIDGIRLLNEVGYGKDDSALVLNLVYNADGPLSPTDQADAFESLQEILDSEAVSKAFVPGIRRHFFNMTAGKAIYSYGPSAQADLRSDDFDDDPAPIKIEDAYIREGSSITNNELVPEYRFENVGIWAVDADPDVNITNNQYVAEQPAAATSSTAVVAPTAGTTYTLRVNADIINGTVEIRLRDMASDGRKVMLPLLNREIPLVVDEWAKPEMGTGCVKITPAHDPNDYEVGLRQGLPMVNILNPDGTLNENAGPYQGQAVLDARENVVANGVQNVVNVAHGSLGDVSKHYDLVVVNILARVIVEMLREGLATCVRPGGKAVAAGIITDHETQVVEALRQEEFALTKRQQRGDWVCLVAERP